MLINQYLFVAYLAGMLFCSVLSPRVYGADASQSTETRVDMSSWHHPTQSVFQAYGVKVLGVVLQDKQATFTVEFPFDPQTSPNEHLLHELCLELLEANGWWDYSLRSELDGVEINVSGNKRSRQVSLDFVQM